MHSRLSDVYNNIKVEGSRLARIVPLRKNWAEQMNKVDLVSTQSQMWEYGAGWKVEKSKKGNFPENRKIEIR